MLAALGSTDRIRKLSARSRSTPQTLCLHRARAYTEVFAKTEGEPLVLRRAKAFKKALEDLPTIIEDDELIVGRRGCRVRSVPIVPECHGGWLLWDIENLPTRKQDPFKVPPEQMSEAKKLLEFWQGKNLYDIWIKSCPRDVSTRVIGTGWADTSAGLFMLGYHFSPPWEKILSSGLKPFEEEICRVMSCLDSANPEHMGKEHFLEALLITIGAIKDFTGRYRQEALRLAEKCTNEQRRQELWQIAEICQRVPYLGAKTFREAIQSVWFIHLLLHIEGTGGAYGTLGRFDQYMYPFFKADLNKILSKEDAQELIEHLFINSTDTISLQDNLTVQNAAGFNLGQTMCIGGIDVAGNDASNELSYICLEALQSVRTTQPDFVLLCHPSKLLIG